MSGSADSVGSEPPRLAQGTGTDFYQTLSLGSRVQLYAAIFFLFAPVGVLSMSSFAPQRGWGAVVAMLLMSGLGAVGWAHSFLYELRFLFVLVPLHLAAFAVLIPLSPPQMAADGMAAAALLILGYVFFVSFINGQGARSLRLQTEIALAEEIHRNLVPGIDERSPSLEVFGRSVPSSEVGGDLLDVVSEDGRHDLFVADVTGHGVSAGVLMAMVKSALRMKLLTSDDLESLTRDLSQVVSQVKSRRMFATFACLRIEGNTASYALAGHLPILHWVAKEQKLHRLSRPSLPLGALQGHRTAADRSYRAASVAAAPGDLFVLLTDGLTEVVDADGRALGLEGIERIVADHSDQPLPELYDVIVQAADDHGANDDDRTLLLARLLRMTASLTAG